MAVKKKMGRPVTPLDWDQMNKLLAMQCTQLEVAAWFNVSEDTLERACKREHGVTYAEYSKQKRQAGCISLRRKQFDVALSGNIAMLIFLGKQYLGQSDKLETTGEATNTARFVIEMSDDRN